MIERIIIENYKSIRKMDLFLRPINILIGANGAGKSNFVSFFELAKQTFEGNIEEYAEDRNGAAGLLYGGIKGSDYISGLLDFENTNAYAFELKPSRNYKVLRVAKSGDYYNDKPKERLDKDYGAGYWQWKSMDNPFRENRNYYIDGYLNSFRVYHFHDTSRTSALRQICAVNDNRRLREDAGNLASFLYLLQNKFPTNFNRVEMVVRSIAPFFDRFNLAPHQLNEEQIGLEWKERGSDLYMDAHSLSDGTLRFMALTALLLQPNPPKTIIIDEPELGLHPFAIHKLAGLLKKVSVKSQVIISTQSAELVSQFDPEDIITVDRKEGQSTFQRLASQQLDHWLEEFSLGDIWQKNIIGGQP